MGLLDRIFKKNTKVVVQEIKETTREKVDASKEIDDILYILKELRFMDAYSIEKEMDTKKKEYDKSILYRLMIDIDDKAIAELKRYVSNEKFGYGQAKINEIKKQLEAKVNECNEQGRSKIETVEEIISIAKEYIRQYQEKLYSLNNTILLLKENSNSEAELIAMIAYWIDNYKEQEFGFPIDLEKKIEEGAAELRNLPEGGYGAEMLKNYIETAKREVEEGKKNNLSDSDISQKIISTLIAQYKRRYLCDLETLTKRIKTIESSTFIGEEEKQKNIAELRIEFSSMYGHIVDIKKRQKEMAHALETLQYGGYGKSKIEEFESLANKLVEEGHQAGKKDKTILAKIEIEYHKLIDEFNSRKTRLEEELDKVESSDISSNEKTAKKKRLKDDFKADSGHKIDLKKKLKEMIEDLGKLENGGYGQSIIRDFKVECEKILTRADKEKTDELSVYRNIQTIYDKYVEDYEMKLKQLKATYTQIDENRSLTNDEKATAKEEFNVEFEMMAGREINLNEKVEEYIKELQELPQGGYGNNAIKEFKDYCLTIINSDKKEKEKYSLISRRLKVLKRRYNSNLELFALWKKDRMKKFKGNDSKTYEEELDKKVSYMLSLSQNELEAYFEKDDQEKKEEFLRHNTEVAVKILARKEAAKSNDDKIYDERIKEFHNGKNPYSEEEIDRAIEEQRKLSIFADNDTPDSDQLLDPVAYIESTLLKQLSSIIVPEIRI